MGFPALRPSRGHGQISRSRGCCRVGGQVSRPNLLQDKYRLQFLLELQHGESMGWLPTCEQPLAPTALKLAALVVALVMLRLVRILCHPKRGQSVTVTESQTKNRPQGMRPASPIFCDPKLLHNLFASVCNLVIFVANRLSSKRNHPSDSLISAIAESVCRLTR